MRILSLLVLAAASTLSPVEVKAAAEMDTQFIEKFEEFLTKFEKNYSPVELLTRLKNFVNNLVRIQVHQAADPKATYTHLTPFADWTAEEFKAYNTFKPTFFLSGKKTKVEVGYLAAAFDWRNESPSPVNAVKDQAQCGSCWAFSSVSNIEGVAVVQGKQELKSLSEQELVDCSTSDNGCGGGLQPRAFQDLIDGPMGLALESDYPYTAQNGNCKSASMTQQVFINSWTSIDSDETQMAAALVKYGPLAVALNATPMQFYGGGVSNPSSCSPYGIDHAVNIVGYGNDSGDDYWTIRNSWGAGWGEDGYYRLIRGIGACGIDQIVSTAIITSNIVV